MFVTLDTAFVSCWGLQIILQQMYKGCCIHKALHALYSYELSGKLMLFEYRPTLKSYLFQCSGVVTNTKIHQPILIQWLQRGINTQETSCIIFTEWVVTSCHSILLGFFPGNHKVTVKKTTGHRKYIRCITKMKYDYSNLNYLFTEL